MVLKYFSGDSKIFFFLADQDNDPNRAPPCDQSICVLPDCYCSEDGTKVPGGLCPGDGPCDRVPQMVTITFDDAINNNNIDLYAEIFNQQRKNPNGCDIKGTFYVSHQYTNYAMVQKLWNQGHEIAVHSITHRGPEEWWGKNATIEDWFDEMVGQAQQRNQQIERLLKPMMELRLSRYLQHVWKTHCAAETGPELCCENKE